MHYDGDRESMIGEKYLGAPAIVGRNKKQSSNTSRTRFGDEYVVGTVNSY